MVVAVRNTIGPFVEIILTKDEVAVLRRLYIEEELTRTQVAEATGWTFNQMCYLLKKHGLVRNPRKAEQLKDAGMSLEYVAGFFDGEGCITIIKSEPRDMRSPRHQLTWGNKKAETFIRQMRPFLRVKREQAEIALEFRVNKGNYASIGRGGTVAADSLEFRETMRRKIQALNSNQGQRRAEPVQIHEKGL